MTFSAGTTSRWPSAGDGAGADLHQRGHPDPADAVPDPGADPHGRTRRADRPPAPAPGPAHRQGRRPGAAPAAVRQSIALPAQDTAAALTADLATHLLQRRQRIKTTDKAVEADVDNHPQA